MNRVRVFFLPLALSLSVSGVALAGVPVPSKPYPHGDPRAALRNLGKLKRPESFKKLNTQAVRKPIEKVTK